MPWSEVTVVNQRTRFVADVERGVFSITEVCQWCGIGRSSSIVYARRQLQAHRRPRLTSRRHRSLGGT